MSIWIGIDEAGYGPVLGPLVVALTAFHVPEGADEEALWGLLAPCASRWSKRVLDRVIIDDSKKVYTGGGLAALENTVLAFASGDGEPPAHVADLHERLALPGPGLEAYPWYGGLDACALPMATTRARLVNLVEALAPLQGGPGPCRFLGMRYIAVHPGEFNEMVRHTRNKSLVEFQKLGILLRFVWEHFEGKDLLVAADKQGGRSHYLRLLSDVFPDAEFKVLGEGAKRSAYRVRSGGRELHVVFKPKADRTHLPVALASILAKYMREVFMARFNHYWCGRIPGLEPTAGYPQDAKRWLEIVRPHLDEALGELTIRSR